MKLNSVILSAIACLIMFLSCSKETVKKYPIEGLWIGTYTVNSAPTQPAHFASLVIYPDGSIVTKTGAEDGKDHYSSGTWTVSTDNVFSATIITFSPNSGSTAVTQKIQANYSPAGKL